MPHRSHSPLFYHPNNSGVDLVHKIFRLPQFNSVVTCSFATVWILHWTTNKVPGKVKRNWMKWDSVSSWACGEQNIFAM
jgi:hypothetical protein